jgi:prevent-host-death family protein
MGHALRCSSARRAPPCGERMLGNLWKSLAMKQIPLSEVQNDVSKYLRLAEQEDIIITRHGKPAGILIGFESEDDWFEYCLEHDPCLLKRIAAARAQIRAGRGVRLEDMPEEYRWSLDATGNVAIAAGSVVRRY